MAGARVIPNRISTDLCGLVPARGVASPQAIFQIDAATRKAKRIPARSLSNEESKLLRVGITTVIAGLGDELVAIWPQPL